MQDKKSNNMNIIFIAASAVIIIIVIVMLVTRIMHLQDTLKQTELMEDTIAKNQIRLNELIRLSKQEEEFKQQIAIMDKMLPDEPFESDIINQAKNASDLSDTDFIQIDFQERVVNNNITTMPLSLVFNGRYQSLLSVIDKLTYGDRLVIIDEISIQQSEDNDGIIEASLKARTFYR
jgi:Tfp pilus assembly protein PilO